MEVAIDRAKDDPRVMVVKIVSTCPCTMSMPAGCSEKKACIAQFKMPNLTLLTSDGLIENYARLTCERCGRMFGWRFRFNTITQAIEVVESIITRQMCDIPREIVFGVG